MQESTGAAVKILGTDRSQRLWATFLAEQAEHSVKLQWLPLLACWLASPSSATPAAQETAHDGTSAMIPISELQQAKGQPASTADPKQGYAPLTEVSAGSQPPSPGKSLPKAGNQGLNEDRGAPMAHKSRGSPKQRAEDSRQAPAAQLTDISLNQHAEQAFQLQEAAMRAGYAAAALPLWEQFLWRFTTYQVRQLRNAQAD